MYRQMIGSLMYLMNMRPYICFYVNTLSQYMVELIHFHLIFAKHVMRYLKGMIYYGLGYVSNCEIILHGYVNSGWDGIFIDKKRTSVCFFSLGSAMISCLGKK